MDFGPLRVIERSDGISDRMRDDQVVITVKESNVPRGVK
jgi:hypothetical protein